MTWRNNLARAHRFCATTQSSPAEFRSPRRADPRGCTLAPLLSLIDFQLLQSYRWTLDDLRSFGPEKRPSNSLFLSEIMSEAEMSPRPSRVWFYEKLSARHIACTAHRGLPRHCVNLLCWIYGHARKVHLDMSRYSNRYACQASPEGKREIKRRGNWKSGPTELTKTTIIAQGDVF